MDIKVYLLSELSGGREEEEKKTTSAINPINELLKRNRWGCVVPAQHQFGIFGDILLHQIPQQSLHDIGEVLKLIVERHSQK